MRYEDMELLLTGQFLSDSRTVEYYMIGNGQILHLLAEASNRLFIEFQKIKEKSGFAPRHFDDEMDDKYVGAGRFGKDEMEALILYDYEQVYVPDSDSDDSDYSSADEQEYVPVVNVPHVDLGGIELELVRLDEGGNVGDNEEQENSDNAEEKSDDEEEKPENENANEDSDDEEETDDEDEDNNFDFLAHVLAHFTTVTILK